HSSYLDGKSFKYMSEQTQGKFGGLGIEVTMEQSVVKVVSPIDDTPASRAGLKPGDYITNIDGENVVGMSLNDAVDKMRGKPGTKIKLTIRRINEKPFDVTLKREEIKIQSVKSDIKDDDVAYIRITSFSEEVDKHVKKAFNKANKDKKIKGIVLDVRNNPGGLLDQAVAVSDLFLDKGEIVSTRSRNPEDTIRYTAKDGDIAKGLPIVVMINDGSASASEIVAGALQDHKRAVVLGEKSFGKGSVQTVVPLGDYGAMRLTTARYYTPSGRSIQAKGIEPDISVLPAKVEEIEKGYNFSEAEYSNALKNEKEDKKENKKEKDAQDKDWRKDYQLSRAVDLVKALSIYTESK
ncbi:MAG: S41 family peptidase, partial [Alphaproteobacteria bacterium]|nr:S41 family peptidase [Alphaproteobacteria bacterium]